MRTTATAAVAAAVLAGCASAPVAEAPTIVRSAAPVNYESAVTNYFDFMVRGPQSNRSLSIGAPEPSDCVMRGGGGAYAGWVVPVIYSTSADPAHSKGAANSASHAEATAKTAHSAARPTAKSATKGTARATHGRTAHAAEAAQAADPPALTTPTASLGEVSITGKSYFFWFSRETINAVTERLGPCP